MSSLRSFAAAVLFFALAASAASAQQSGITMQPSRFSGPGVYTGPPALRVTLSMVMAGGGPAHFQSVELVKRLTGPKFTAEVDKLNKQYGKEKVGTFLEVFNYVVDDSLKVAAAKHVALPSSPSPDPNDGEALAGALWAAGQTGHGFNVEVMLDRAVSHPIHVQVMDDIDRKYGVAKDADYHAVLTTAMHDLAAAYHFNAQGKMGTM